jgi:hypothetical protein
MVSRKKAADYFLPADENASGGVAESQGDDISVQSDGDVSGLRRSSRLHSTTFTVPQAATKATRRRGTRETVKQSLHVKAGAPSAHALPSKANVSSSPFVDKSSVVAREHPNSPGQEGSQPSDPTIIKSPATEDQYVSAVEDITETLNLAPDSSTLGATPRPSHTQNTLDNIPSSQPRPRSQRSPLPLLPIPSSPPPTSLPTSTPTASQSKSTTASAQPIIPTSLYAEDSDDSDDEAPESISLSQCRSQALASQTKLAQRQRLEAEKTREKRRKRDVLLASQKQSKKRAAETLKEQSELEEEDEQGLDSQPSADVESGNTTDTPAPNQAHQAARLARHSDALPADILRAASSTWFKDTEGEKSDGVVVKKKRKVKEDDGIRILEELNIGIAPKAGKIGLVKEKMIMRMGKGQRRMFVGRFSR